MRRQLQLFTAMDHSKATPRWFVLISIAARIATVGGLLMAWLFRSEAVSSESLGEIELRYRWGRVHTVRADPNGDGCIDAIYTVSGGSKEDWETRVTEGLESMACGSELDLRWSYDPFGELEVELDTDHDSVFETRLVSARARSFLRSLDRTSCRAISPVGTRTGGQHDDSRSSEGGLVGAAERQLYQQVQWVGLESRASWSATLTFQGDGSIRVILRVQNDGKNPIYVMTGQEWWSRVETGTLHLVFGEPYVDYGRQLPALQRLEPGEQVLVEEPLDLPASVVDLHRVDVYFHALLDGAAELDSQLQDLPEESGWWLTEDLVLATRFADRLAQQLIPFPLPCGLRECGPPEQVPPER